MIFDMSGNLKIMFTTRYDAIMISINTIRFQRKILSFFQDYIITAVTITKNILQLDIGIL